jgi:A1 cistron-splicing factor AAR2
MRLTPEGAEYHYETGAFIIVSDLPEGSQVGIDGEDKVTSQFMGYKMIPSGLHLFTHSPPAPSDAPMAMAVRHGLFRTLRSRQTLVLKYSAEEEELIPNLADAQTGEEVETVLTREHLKTLDPNLGVYPLYLAKVWQNMTNCITTGDVERVVGKAGKLDSLMESPADDEVVKGKGKVQKVAQTGEMNTLDFVAFDLKRSWGADAVGEEVTRYSKDKSWLWRHVVNTHLESSTSFNSMKRREKVC